MKLALALILALALPACASASGGDGDGGDSGGGDGFGRAGPYLGLAAVQGLEHFSPGGRSISADDSNVGFAARGGWRTEGGLAIEGGIEGVTGYNIDSTAGKSDLDISTVVFTGKYYILDDRIQPYVLAGLGWAWSDTKYRGLDESAAFGRIGVGTDIYLTGTVALFGEVNYNRMTSGMNDLDNMNMLVGLMFRF